MTRAGFEYTKIGRSYAALAEWWEEQQVRGAWSNSGMPWESHPSWQTPDQRDYWHRNWGELLNNHATAHIRKIMTNGVTHRRLRVRVTHADVARLELVRSVTGGSIEPGSGPRTIARLEMETLVAFNALKAGRMYVDPANKVLLDALDAAMDFYKWVPKQGQGATDEQAANQEDCIERLDRLMGAYITVLRAPHDCNEGIRRAGMADWTAPEPADGPRFTLF